ncbi:MAG: helix-turn-helix transcriptional regulator [bacterium]|nr:helix-turn-helix transcriptional regulator [bacterium]
MIQIKLRDMMFQRRIRNLSELARQAGVARQTLDGLYNRPENVKGIRLETINRLCQALECRIEDVMQYVPDHEANPTLPVEVVREDDPDYAIFQERADESVTPFEACDELFERLDQIRRQRENQG